MGRDSAQRKRSRPETLRATGPQPFPSPRQAKCAGLQKRFYAAHVRELVDMDYVDKLPPDVRVWLAAFTEEHYRGYRLRKETQVTRIEHIRAADAGRKRVVRAEDVHAFRQHLEPERRAVKRSARLVGSDGTHAPSEREFALLAGHAGIQEHELRASNRTEDALIDALDEHRAASERTETADKGLGARAPRVHTK